MLARIVFLAAVLMLLADPASAQKTKDTLRIAFSDPISTVDPYFDPKPETGLTSEAVFDTLLCYDHDRGSFEPLLARSWRQVDDRTIEFDLRRDIRFHDGARFTADDVVGTLNWLIEPGNTLRFAPQNFAWLERAEKVDEATVRIVAKRPTPLAVIQLAVSGSILPAKLLDSYAVKADFGRKTPVGTGPYKVEAIDAADGVRLAKNAAYHHGGSCKPAAQIGRIRIVPIPDSQTQIAQLTTGGIDFIHIASKDQSDLLAHDGDLKVTASQGLLFYYMTMDAIGRSGNAALSNETVRRAIVQSVDRDLVVHNVVPGGDQVRTIDALCLPNQRGCDYTTKPYPYDPDAARKLLSEAGYPDGLDVEITAIPGAETLAEALAGELRKIGVRAKVDKVTFGTYRQRQRDGKTQMIVGQFSLGGLPDVSATVNFYFDGAARDFWRDPLIARLATEGLATMDEGRRKAIYREIFDRVNEKAYILPISTRPDVFVHTKDLVVRQGSFNTYGADLFGMRWQ